MPSFVTAVLRAPARPTAPVALTAVFALALSLMLGISPAQARPEADRPSTTTTAAVPAASADTTESTTEPAESEDDAAAAELKERRTSVSRRVMRRSAFSVATLNLRKGMTVGGLRHDIGTVLRETDTSVIGFQERYKSRPLLRAALPRTWRLLMPSGPTGTDDNPIAFNPKVWKLRNTWVATLAKRTWRRFSGKIAHPQYGVVAVLEHRRSGHTIRAVSFHLPNGVHNRGTGGPNWRNRDEVEALWRMAARVRFLKNDAPAKHQFVAMCDCNVTESRDRTDQLVKGRITRPLGLENNYSAGGYKPGWRIDYVMGERRSPYRIAGWKSFRNLLTDHPGVVARFTYVR